MPRVEQTLELTGEALQLPGDAGLTLIAYTVEPRSPSKEALRFLASWSGESDVIESVVVEARTKEYVAARIRAGILDSYSVNLLRSVGLGAGVEAYGDEHRGIYLQWPSERHLDFVDLVGRSVWVYGQTQVQADLVAASEAAGRQLFYGASGAALHDLESDHPFVTFSDTSGTAQRIDAVTVAGCDGSFGPSRAAVPDSRHETWERVYPYSWLGILADVPPSTDESARWRFCSGQAVLT